MLTRRRLAGVGIVSFACAVFAACTGDEAVLIRGGNDDAAPPDGGGESDAPRGSPGDGGPDGSSAGCGARDTTPCNCGPSKSCCPGAGDGFACFERGTEDQDAASGCTSNATIRCAATGCGANRVCCFNGAVTPGGLCPKRMTQYDTECIDVVGGGFPCVDTTNGVAKVLMCLDDADCVPFDAGTCVSALMDGFHRVMGICAR